MKAILRRTAQLLLALAIVAGCLHTPLRTAAGVTTIADPRVPLSDGILQPKTPGTVTHSGGGATIDASNVAEGYLAVKYSGSAGKAKVRITASGKTTYTYNLRADGKYEFYPLNGGSGKYQVVVYYNLSGDQYAEAVSKNIDVKLRDATLPFLYPNQYVNFTASSKAVAKGAELAKGAPDSLTVVSNVYNYVIGNISYDTDKANVISQGGLAGYVPDIDSVLSSQKGICFDYAALMSAMLRSQGIPTRMEHGYVSGGAYHAWISVYIKDLGWVNGVIQFDGKSWKLMDPTFAASGGANSQYVGSGVNYQTQYCY